MNILMYVEFLIFLSAHSVPHSVLYNRQLSLTDTHIYIYQCFINNEILLAQEIESREEWKNIAFTQRKIVYMY
jgi:hypothetical protein